MPDHSLPATITEVVERLDSVAACARRDRSRVGYFAVLYRNVTVAVQRGIASGRFENGDRMEELDVRFANRYFEAYDAYADGASPSRSWRVAFDAASIWRPTILQHLLLGMNAHINLDLAIAAARTCPGAEIAGLERDFREINLILAEMLAGAQDCLSAVSPWHGLLDVVGGTLDELIARVGITGGREWAWMSALHLAALDADDQPRVIDRIDRSMADVGRFVLKPGLWYSSISFIVRSAERKAVGEVMDALAVSG